MEATATKYHELYEAVEGTAIEDIHCDGCMSPFDIKKGEKCFAAVLLDSRKHPNYELQLPAAWAHQFINITAVAGSNEQPS